MTKEQERKVELPGIEPRVFACDSAQDPLYNQQSLQELILQS